jgi:hypothetical protein
VLAGIAVIVVVALVIGGLLSSTVRTFALGAPNQNQVALLHPGSRVCEGPVTSSRPVNGIGIWGASALGPAAIRVEVQDAATRRALQSAELRATTRGQQYSAYLPRPIAAGSPLRVCLTESLNTFALLGSGAIDPKVVMTGPRRGQEFSLVLLNHGGSMLSWLSTAFSRASLFRPSWVGSWTFWVLILGLLATFGLGVAATALAASADDRDDRDDRGDGDDHGPDEPPPSPDGTRTLSKSHSTASQ